MAALFPLPFLASALAYCLAVVVGRRRDRAWPTRRTWCWLAGTAACLMAVTPPLAELSDSSFAAHMLAHLLLGMVGPLLLVRGAPVTLALRTLPVAGARRLARLLLTRPVRLLTSPVPAAIGDAGGLWLLYSTDLYRLAESHPWLHLLVHAHVFTFGYLFAASIVGIDPDRHRAGFALRSTVLVLVSAAHAVLAKHLYAAPPPGVDAASAETAAAIMYYGGDVLEITVMVLLGHSWYGAIGRGIGGSRPPVAVRDVS